MGERGGSAEEWGGALRKLRTAPTGGGVSGRAARHPLPSRPAPRAGWKLLVWRQLHSALGSALERMRARGAGSPAPPLTPAWAASHTRQPSTFALGCGQDAGAGREEGRKEGRQAGSEALRGHGQGWAVGHQAQEVSPSPACRLAGHLPQGLEALQSEAGLSAPSPKASTGAPGQPAAHTPLPGTVPSRRHGGSTCCVQAPRRWGSRRMGISRPGPWGPWEPARQGPRTGRGSGRSVDTAGSLSPLPTDQAPPSCSGPWGWPPQRPLRHLSPQRARPRGRAGSFLPPHGGRGPGSSCGLGLLSGLALRGSAAGGLCGISLHPLLEGRGCG